MDEGIEEQEENSGNNNNSEISTTGDTIIAHLDRGKDNKFEESLLLAAHNNDIGFNITEPNEYSLAL